MLHLNNITFRMGPRTLLDDTTVHLPAGAKVGFVGRNGTGKSTLLNLIMGDLSLDDGSITIRPTAKVGIVSQEAPTGSITPLESVLMADRERHDLLEREQTETDPHKIADIHNRLAEIGAHAAPARAASILAGLGFDAAAQDRPLSSFSGGWRMRVSLAATLFQQPDLLLLDEPTNHLDLEATLWLESYLKSYPYTILMVSHDRDMLNSVVDRILHLENNKLTLYKGNYDTFERTRRERLIRESKMLAKQEEERRRIQSFVDRFKAKATKAKQAQSRMKMLERMEPIAAVVEDAKVTLAFPKPEILPPPLVTGENLVIGYGDVPILRNVNFTIDHEDRIGLLGANGNGKSTLAKLLADRLRAIDGKGRRVNKLKVGFFAQHQLEDLDADRTAYQHLAKLLPEITEERVRARLGYFGLPQDKADTKASHLSGGEKARLVLALITYNNPHMLILDEPTNHLDIDAREALVQALNEYDGCVILISHDRHLMEACVDRFWLVNQGTVSPYDGTMEDYQKLLLSQRGRSASGDAGGKKQENERKVERRSSAEKRQQLKPLRDKIKRLEELMEKLTTLQEALESKLADPATYNGPSETVTELQKKLADIQNQLTSTEEQWLERTDELETLQAAQQDER